MKKFLTVLAMALVLVMCAQSALACTIVSVGKDATTDGSTITTHNDDSTSADFRLWIIPSMEGGEGIKRDLVIDSHNYADFSDYPNTKDYGNGMLVAEMDQPEDTYAYFHSRYSFINEKGVAMGEATMSYFTDDYAKTANPELAAFAEKSYNAIFNSEKGANGIIDCWNAQDIALERAATAREAVEVMADLVETYGWGTANGGGETINIVDGNEVWIFEAYGADLWAAARIPDNAFFVAANRARINEFDFEDKENFLCSENLVSFAEENGLYNAETDGAFMPAQIYNPCPDMYMTMREWRALDLAAPSLGLEYAEDAIYPLYVIPDEKLSVRDVFEIKGDYYEGTEYDVSRMGVGGDFGNPLNFNNNGIRTINMMRTCYVMIANVKAWLPDEIKCLVWYGYGAPDSTFITPLWPTMTEMPSEYTTGTRYEDYSPESGWWVNTLLQDTATRNYDYCIEVIEERRDARMDEIFVEVAELQEKWAAMIEAGFKAEAIEEMTEYANDTANEWFDIWRALTNELISDTVWGRLNTDGRIHGGSYSEWWNGVIADAGLKPIEEAA